MMGEKTDYSSQLAEEFPRAAARSCGRQNLAELTDLTVEERGLIILESLINISAQ